MMSRMPMSEAKNKYSATASNRLARAKILARNDKKERTQDSASDNPMREVNSSIRLFSAVLVT